MSRGRTKKIERNGRKSGVTHPEGGICEVQGRAPGSHVLFCDGSVRLFTPPPTLKNLSAWTEGKVSYFAHWSRKPKLGRNPPFAVV